MLTRTWRPEGVTGRLLVPSSARDSLHPLLRLQQTAGNRATTAVVQRMEEGGGASTDEPLWTTPAELGGPETGDGRDVDPGRIVGLEEGDGVTFGTWDRRPAVETLQQLLNDHGGGLEVDGMWGAKTTAALQAFEATSDLPRTTSVDDTVAATLTSGGGAGGGDQVTPGGDAALPDISGIVGGEIAQLWASPLEPYDTVIPLGSLPTLGSVGGSFPGMDLGMAPGTDGGPSRAGAPSLPMGDDLDSWSVRYQYYKPVLDDMWRRDKIGLDHATAFAALVEASAAAAASWASRAFSWICGSLAGIVLGPPGVALWNMANEFLGLGRRVAEETETGILRAAADPVAQAALGFDQVVWDSYRQAFPMREPEMPWYVTGANAIATPIVMLRNAEQQLRQLSPQ